MLENDPNKRDNIFFISRKHSIDFLSSELTSEEMGN